MNMKKIFLILLTVMLAFCFVACGETSPAETVANETTAPAETEATETVTEAATEPQEDLKALAEEFIDRQVSELIAAIGEPQEAEYVSSCIGPGEDGVLTYEGFCVYTYKEGDSEVVRIVD